jgi:hypothetical protein
MDKGFQTGSTGGNEGNILLRVHKEYTAT